MSDNESVCSRRSQWKDKFDTASGKWKCPECGSVFNSSETLRKHSHRKHPVDKGEVKSTPRVKDVDSGKWKCPYCKKDNDLVTRNGLRMHVAQVHSKPVVALEKAAASTGGAKRPAPMGPPKSKVVVPAPKEAGVLAAMTRLAGYEVMPETDARVEEELRRARTATLVAAAEAALASRKRFATDSPSKVSKHTRVEATAKTVGKGDRRKSSERLDRPTAEKSSDSVAKTGTPTVQVTVAPEAVATEPSAKQLSTSLESAKPRKVVLDRGEPKRRPKTRAEGLGDEPACSIALAAPSPPTRTVSLDDLVQWSVDLEPVVAKESRRADAFRKAPNEETEYRPRTGIVGGLDGDCSDHLTKPRGHPKLAKPGDESQPSIVSFNSVSCEAVKTVKAAKESDLPAGTVDVGCQTQRLETWDTTQVTDGRMWARVRLVVDYIDQLSVATGLDTPEMNSGSRTGLAVPNEVDLRTTAYLRLRYAKVTKRSICILLVVARELGLLVYADVGDEEDWRAKIQLGLRATLRRMERRQRSERVQILGEVTRSCMDAQFGEDDLRTIVFGALLMAPRHMPVVYTRRSARKPELEDGMSTSSDEEFEARRHPSSKADKPAAVGAAPPSSKVGHTGDEEPDDNSQRLSDEDAGK